MGTRVLINGTGYREQLVRQRAMLVNALRAHLRSSESCRRRACAILADPGKIGHGLSSMGRDAHCMAPYDAQRAKEKRPLVALLGLMVASLATLPLLPPIAQDPSYHQFADQRTLLGISNFWNVVSNFCCRFR